MDGPGGVGGARQAVEVVQNVRAPGIELEVELAAAAELGQVQPQAPPGQKACLVKDEIGVACVGQVVELGEKVMDGLDESAGHDQGRPAWRRLCWAWRCTRARLRAWISLSSC